jgi:hypothetical protein
MWRVLMAELRQWAGIQAVTLVIGSGLLLVAWGVERENVAAHGRPLDPNEMWILFVWMFLCSVPPMIGWYWNISWNKFSTFRLIDSMPLSSVKLNLTRLLSLPVQFSSVLVLWFILHQIFHHFDRSVTPWLAVAAFFYLMIWSAAALSHVLFWAAMWGPVALLALVGLLGIHGQSHASRLPLYVPWIAVALGVLAVGVGWWVVAKCHPRTAD